MKLEVLEVAANLNNCMLLNSHLVDHEVEGVEGGQGGVVGQVLVGQHVQEGGQLGQDLATLVT